MRNALIFREIDAFWDFIRLHGSEGHNARGYSLYLAQPQTPPTRPLLLLVGFVRKKSLLGKLFSHFFENTYHIEENQSSLRLFLPDRSQQDLLVLQRRDAQDLLSLVDLVPALPLSAPKEHVIFWLHDPDQLGPLVEISMRLQNDRIQYAPLHNPPHNGLLLRIEAPSFYLLQICKEQYSKQITLYTEEATDFFTPWGYRHPLIDLWRLSEMPREPRWTFVPQGAPPQTIAPVQWQDIYKAAQFVLQLHTEQDWEESKEQTPRFSLPLRFEPRNRPLEPEIWLLEEQHRPQLERQLSLMDEDDLSLLLINIQKDQDGKHRFFLREKQIGKGRAWLDFGGQRFACYKGIHQLLLPVDIELQPQLRRDQYTPLFDLRAGILTFVTLPSASTHRMEEATLTRIREDAFAPLRQYIDYLITQNIEHLQSIQQQSVFDLGRYTRAPYRPELLNTRQSTSSRDTHTPKDREKSAQETSPKETNEPQTSPTQRPPTPRSKTNPTATSEHRRSALEEEERTLEAQLLQDPQSDDFFMLAQLKQEMQKLDEAQECLIEALWLASPPNEALLKKQLQEIFFKTAHTKHTNVPTENAQIYTRRDAFLSSLFTAPTGVRTGWLQTHIQWLRQSEALLRKKLRWLAWREVLRCNRDQREAARVRESMLRELNEYGLSITDIPTFLQRAFANNRQLFAETQDAQNDQHLALHHLHYLRHQFAQLQLPPFRIVGQALVGAGHLQAGVLPTGVDLLQEAQQYAEDDQELDLWVAAISHSVASHAGEAFEIRTASRLQHHTSLLEKQPFLKEKIEECSRLLQPAKEKELQSAFAASNVRRLYTDAPIHAPRLQEAFAALQEAHKQGKADHIEHLTQTFLSVLRDAIRGEGDFSRAPVDYNEVAKAISRFVDLLGKLRWGGSGHVLLAHFLDFVRVAPSRPPDESDSVRGLFFMLMRLHIAQGLVSLERLPQAIEIIQQCLMWLYRWIDNPIDFLDFCGVALQAIEELPLQERNQLLQSITDQFVQQINAPDSTMRVYYEGSALQRLGYLLQLQLVRIAASKEQLALGQMKQYMDRDEMALRERILHEDLTQPMGE